MGDKKVWTWLESSKKRLTIITGIIVALVTIYSYVGVKVEKALIQPFLDTEMLVRANAVHSGVLMDLSQRIDSCKNFSIDNLEVMIFLVKKPDVYYAFISDPRLGHIPYRCYYDISKCYWYYHSFDERSYTVIEEK